MSIHLTLSQNDVYAEITPAGAFYATSSPDEDVNRSALTQILRDGPNQPFTEDAAVKWTGMSNTESALTTLYRLQKLGMIRGTRQVSVDKAVRLEDILPPLLERLSDQGKTLLADENGFYLSAAGFPHESAEELAGLSADLLSLQDRHSRLLKNNLRLHTESWGMLDPSGRSLLGFWPLFIGKQRFMLVVGGTPRLQDQSFVTMIRELDKRYH